MRVALFTDTFAPQVNGVTMTLTLLMNYWKRMGIDFLIFAPEDEPKMDDSASIHRVNCFPFPLYPQLRIPMVRFMKIEQQMRFFHPDLIHVATPATLGLMGIRYGQRHQIPLVASYHTNFDQYLDYYGFPFLKKFFWSYIRWFHNHCQRNYCPSTITKEVLEENGIKNVEIWSRGIDSSIYHPSHGSMQIYDRYGIDKSKLLLLYVGRIAAEKDLSVLLESYRTLSEDVKRQVHLLMVGDGPLLTKYQSAADTDITWTGILRGQELPEIYASSDLFVFPSSSETFGNVVLEAMASGLPVIGVDAGGVRDIITHGRNGLLCQPKSVESFRAGIHHLVRDKQLRMQMSYFARFHATGRNWDVILQQLVKSYEQVIMERNLSKQSYKRVAL